MTLLRAVLGAIGLEGAFLTAGTIALAVASSYLSPAGPWLVVGVALTLTGLALVVPPRK